MKKSIFIQKTWLSRWRRPYTVALNSLLVIGLASFVVDEGAMKPDESRFTPVVLAEDLDEPMVFEVAKDGTAYIIERKGAFKKYDPVTKTVNLIATIPVNTKYTSAEGRVSEAEEGLMGLTLDPNFEQNHWVYLYYAHPTEKKHMLTRWELRDGKLVDKSEKVMLEVPTQREVCCHTGGGMTWDRTGNLYLTVGNNTGNQQAAQTDERPGRSSWDDQGHAGNTNDLRGKILRIRPQPDGTYTIPDGNLFPKGTAKTRPEIYSMGHRNAWRISIDSKTGYVYWGEVGPDATSDSEIGPRGYDELNQARKPGNFGWPWFVGNRQAFPVYDYGEKKPLEKKDPDHLVNTSPNNTGLRELPPVAPSFIYYPYGEETVSFEGLTERIQALLEDIQQTIYNKAKAFREAHTFTVDTFEEFQAQIENGFLLAHWDGTSETEEAIKEATKATIRCIPFDQQPEEGVCVYSGKPSKGRVVFSRAY